MIITGVVLGGPAASASSNSDTPDILEEVTANNEGSLAVLENIANGATSSRANFIDDTINGVRIVVPEDPELPVRLGTAEITLPVGSGSSGEVLRAGVVEFSDVEVEAAVIAKNDGSVQITTLIADSSSPESFTYEITVPTSTSWSEMDNGALFASDSAGDLVLGVAPAWAIDAEGSSVPTRYVLNGDHLTQIVDHRTGDFAYPIVADPWLGAAIFARTEWHPTTQTAVAALSTWGFAIQTGSGFGVGGWAAGQAILKGAGWDELRGKVPAVNTKATYRQQYDCHVLGAVTPFTGGTAWDLEGTRSSNSNWLNNVAKHKCNW